MQKCLLNLIYAPPEYIERIMIGRMTYEQSHTMIGYKRLKNVQHCIENIILLDIEGDFIETGVWNGGVTIFMRAILKEHSVTDRKVWVADSFQGCPIPNPDVYPHDKDFNLFKRKDYAITIEQVKSNFVRYDLLDDQVQFLAGWFKDTLPTAPIEKIALLRLDGDLYESTMDGLIFLYPKVSSGGYIIVDDYNCYVPCKQAVTDYRKKYNIQEEIREIDWTGVYWRKL